MNSKIFGLRLFYFPPPRLLFSWLLYLTFTAFFKYLECVFFFLNPTHCSPFSFPRHPSQYCNSGHHIYINILYRKPFAIAALADVKPAFATLPVASTIPMLEYRGSEGYFAEGIAIDGCNSGGYSSKGWNSTTITFHRGSYGGGDTH